MRALIHYSNSISKQLSPYFIFCKSIVPLVLGAARRSSASSRHNLLHVTSHGTWARHSSAQTNPCIRLSFLVLVRFRLAFSSMTCTNHLPDLDATALPVGLGFVRASQSSSSMRSHGAHGSRRPPPLPLWHSLHCGLSVQGPARANTTLAHNLWRLACTPHKGIL